MIGGVLILGGVGVDWIFGYQSLVKRIWSLDTEAEGGELGFSLVGDVNARERDRGAAFIFLLLEWFGD